MRQHRLARAGFALDQQRTAQRHRRIDRDFQVFGRDVGLGAFETLLRLIGHGFSCKTDGQLSER